MPRYRLSTGRYHRAAAATIRTERRYIAQTTVKLPGAIAKASRIIFPFFYVNGTMHASRSSNERAEECYVTRVK